MEQIGLFHISTTKMKWMHKEGGGSGKGYGNNDNSISSPNYFHVFKSLSNVDWVSSELQRKNKQTEMFFKEKESNGHVVHI